LIPGPEPVPGSPGRDGGPLVGVRMPRPQPQKPIETIVREVGRYPLAAFAFVQECIGLASEKVHGPVSPAEEAVGKWMNQHDIDLAELTARYERGDLPPDIAEALRKVGGPARMNRHVTGQELCLAIRDIALERWGLMARAVLARWGIERTEDIGAIVFALVDNGWLQKQPSDCLSDFDHVFSFHEAFGPSPRLT